MHEDPTRMMRQPDDNRPRGNMRLLIAGLLAVIVGLIVAIVVIAGNDNAGGTSTSTVSTVPTETTGSSTETTGSSTETTSSTPTETTAPTTTTTPTTTTVPTTEEENGSGGVPAP